VLDVDPGWLGEQTAPQRESAARALNEETAAGFEAAVLQALRDEGQEPPTDPGRQLTAAIRAVFESWDSRRARLYRVVILHPRLEFFEGGPLRIGGAVNLDWKRGPARESTIQTIQEFIL